VRQSVRVSVVGGIAEKRFDDSQRTRVGRIGESQWQGSGVLQLVGDHFEDAALLGVCSVETLEIAGVQDKLGQQWRNIHHKTARWQLLDQAGQEIERPHGDRRGNGDRMGCSGRNPDRPQRRHDPQSVRGAQGHYPPTGVEQLILGMIVLGNYVRSGEVVGDTGRVSQQATAFVAKDAVALLRHFLSH